MAKSNDKNAGDKLFVDFVSQDKDWRGVIDNELRCQNSWHKVWGFLADDTVSEKPLTKDEKIQVLEEKLKNMSDIKLVSNNKQSYKGGVIDFKQNTNNKTKFADLQPQSRRPYALSKAHKHLTEAIGKDYEKEPYQNYLGSK